MSMCGCQTGKYKEHFACFSCRKMHRLRPYRELPEFSRPANYFDYSARCPDCNATMLNMSKEFKPPKQSQIKQWRQAEAEYWQKRRNWAMHTYLRKLKTQTEMNSRSECG